MAAEHDREHGQENGRAGSVDRVSLLPETLPATRSLADDLRRRSDDELAQLFAARPDLAFPAPGDITSLAARAVSRAAIVRALDGLDTGHVQVLEATAVVGGSGQSEAVAELLGSDPRRVTPMLERLWQLALLWRADGWHVPHAVSELLGPHIAGLAGVAAGFAARPAAEIDAALAGLGVAERAVLDRLTWGPPIGRLPASGAAADAGRRLLAAGLLAALPDPGGDSSLGREVLLTRDVALRLRGGHVHRRFEPDPPVPAGRTLPDAQVARAAGGQAVHLLTLVDEVLTRWSGHPPRVLRGGGLAARDLRTVASELDVPLVDAAFVVELIRDAGLVADDGSIDPAWTPTYDYDVWTEMPTPRRWLVLARAWVDSLRAPHRVGTKPEGSASPVNAFSDGAAWPRLRTLRREILAELALLDSGLAPDLDELAARFRWRHPLRPEDVMREALTATLAAAELLGVTGRGALSPAGRALVSQSCDDDAGLLAMVGDQLPEPIEHALLQADLTAVVPGPPGPRLGALLRVVAEQESRGGASVFRFTPSSIRRALDAGWAADDLLAQLAASSSTPVPQPLAYLVTDTARRHGTLRVGSMSSFVRSDDTAALDALAASRECAPLQLRRLAPTVLVSPTPPAALLQILRKAGVAPVLEGHDGIVVVADSQPVRARRRPTAPVTRGDLDDEQVRALIAALRAGQLARDDAGKISEGPGPRVPPGDPAVVVALVREAIAQRGAVWIGLADSDGTTRRVRMTPTRIDGGRIHGEVDGRAGEQMLALHRITGAVLAS